MQEAFAPQSQLPSLVQSFDQQASKKQLAKGAGHFFLPMPYLLLDKRQLFEIAFQECHLLLLSFAVAILDHVIVLFL